MPKKYEIDIVEPDTDSKIKKMFERLSDSEDESHNSDIKKYNASAQEKVKEVKVSSQRKIKNLLV